MLYCVSYAANQRLKAIALLMTALQRPTSTPILLLLLHCFIAISKLIWIIHQNFIDPSTAACPIAEAVLALLGVATILVMPMRDPKLGTDDVCSPFGRPTYHLRSPEVNLSLWQFMTVAWMAPLISLGNKKQLDDSDVWLLPYEFQHSRLHLLFQEVRGSVLIRLLQVNGLDLFITTLLGTLESVCRNEDLIKRKPQANLQIQSSLCRSFFSSFFAPSKIGMPQIALL